MNERVTVVKPIAFILLLALGFILPLACTNSAPTGPLATYNLTATFTNTVTLTPTNWAGYTSTATRVPGAITNTPTMTMTVTNTQTVTNTFTPSNTPSAPTPIATGSAWSTSNAPNGLAYDGTNIYVAEGVVGSSGGEVETFNTSGTSIGKMTTYDGTHAFGQPGGVAYYGSHIYVTDQVNNAIYEIDPSTNNLINSVTTWTATGGGPGSFSGPEGIAADSNGNIYVADTGNDYIEVFNSSLAIISGGEFGGLGDGNGEFNNPSAVAVTVTAAPATLIYVADASNQRVEQFDGTFTYTSQFSTGQNSDVYGIALDGSGNIYIADVGQGQVAEYNSSGSYLTSGLGISPSNSPSPDGLVFIGSNLLVADYSNNALYLVTP